MARGEDGGVVARVCLNPRGGSGDRSRPGGRRTLLHHLARPSRETPRRPAAELRIHQTCGGEEPKAARRR